MRGPGTSAEQIRVLRGKLGADGVEKAKSIVSSNKPDVITLAYRLMRSNITDNKLPKAVAKLLEKMPDKEAAEIRSQLVKASIRPV